jgi:hypothetical protein
MMSEFQKFIAVEEKREREDRGFLENKDRQKIGQKRRSNRNRRRGNRRR